MKNALRVGVIASATVAAAMWSAFGCGDDANGTGTSPDGGTGSSTSGGSSGAGSSSGTGSSGGSSSGTTSSSGLVPAPDDPQPGLIACGSSSCDVEGGTSNCCLRPEGATCTGAGDRCDGGIRHICDEGKDCDNPDPTSCCLGVYGTGTVARCTASGCVGSNPQLCRSTAECDGDICAFATCSIGSGTVTIRTCGGKC